MVYGAWVIPELGDAAAAVMPGTVGIAAVVAALLPYPEGLETDSEHLGDVVAVLLKVMFVVVVEVEAVVVQNSPAALLGNVTTAVEKPFAAAEAFASDAFAAPVAADWEAGTDTTHRIVGRRMDGLDFPTDNNFLLSPFDWDLLNHTNDLSTQIDY